ncbi:MAG: hypothetical protein VZR09_09155 [Candidatus Gastranaerophilaceae bacterium]|nr:hypothetical protein [Candidatus Gastranaerophilaceae bacterium]
MPIGKVELEGTLAKYYSVYDTNGEHLFNTDCFYKIDLYGYTDSTVTIIDGDNIIVYGEDGEIIKRTEDTRLESCLASNKTPVFCFDKSILKKSINAIKKTTAKNYDTSHTQQTMRDAKQRDTEKRAKVIAKQKAIFKARIIKFALTVIATLIFYILILL